MCLIFNGESMAPIEESRETESYVSSTFDRSATHEVLMHMLNK